MNNTGLKGHALVIGIDAYETGIPALQSAVRDAKAIAATLQSDHGYDVTLLCDKDASLEAIDHYLNITFPPQLAEESAFIFYFAGHGIAVGNGSEGPQGYFLPHSAQLGNEDSWYAMDRLRKTLDEFSSRHLLVIFDCCFAGSFRWASSRDINFAPQRLYDSQFKRYLSGNAWQALTSAAHDERAADLSPVRDQVSQHETFQGHSPFAAALLRGLSGAADSSRVGHEPDGVITATELYQYIFEELKPATASSGQTPGIWPLRENNSGEFVFRSPVSELNTLTDPPLNDDNNPWLGLTPYSPAQRDLFYGRQSVVDALLERVVDENATSLLAIVGASGTGKSSVVKAGLLPILANPPEDLKEQIGKWSIVHCARLNAEPCAQLKQAVTKLDGSPTHHRQLLLIDQFEELYTQCPQQAQRAQFLTDLRKTLHNRDKLIIVITLRSDFESRPSRSDPLRDIWDDAKFLVPAFTRDDFRQVIEGPAKAKALFFDPYKLIDTLLDEIMSMPGALPLLSFSLAEMYRCAQRRRANGATDRTIRDEDYKATGGVIGALHERASTLYSEELDKTYRNTIRRVFMRMTSTDGSGYTRRRVLHSELDFGDDVEQARVEQVIKRFVDARLLVRDGEFIEPAHDTLVIAWDKLQDWLSAAGPQDLIRAVYRAATDWQDNDNSKGLLWNDDPRLPLVLSQWGELNKLEKSFVNASERNRKFLIKKLIFGSLLIGAVILVAAAVAFWQRNVAIEQEQNALQQRDEANAAALLANAQALVDPVSKGLVIAEITAQKLPQPSRVNEVALLALSNMDNIKGIKFTSEGYDVTQSRVDDHISFKTLEGTSIFDSWSFEPVSFKYQPQKEGARWATFASNEQSVFMHYSEGGSVFWQDPLNSETVLYVPGRVTDFAANAAGSTVIIATGNYAQVFQTLGKKLFTETFTLAEQDAGVVSVALNANESVVATGSSDGRIALWDMTSGDLLEQKELGINISRIDISYDDKFVVAGGQDGTVILWRRQGDNSPQEIGNCGAAIQWLTLSPRGQVLAAVCNGQAWIWNTDDLTTPKSYPSSGLKKVKFVLWPDSFYPGGPWPNAFSHDGLWLIGVGGGEPITWPVVTGIPAPSATGLLDEAKQSDREVTISGSQVSVRKRSGDKTIVIGHDTAVESVQILDDFILVRGESGHDAVRLLSSGDLVTAIVAVDFGSSQLTSSHLVGSRFSDTPDQQQQVVVTLRNLVNLEDHITAIDWIHPYEPSEYQVQAAGEKILVIATNRIFWSLALFDLNSPVDSIKILNGYELNGVVLSPDGQQLLLMANTMNPNIIHKDPVLYNTENLSKVRDLTGQRFVRHGQFSLDGRHLVTTDCYGESRVWNADGSGDPLIYNQRPPEKPKAMCGPKIEFAEDVLEPNATFSKDGKYLFTQRHDEAAEIHTIDFEMLSEQIIKRTFACLTIEQGEQFLMKSAQLARADYDACMAELGFEPSRPEQQLPLN
jgi:WD40 repeat protein